MAGIGASQYKEGLLVRLGRLGRETFSQQKLVVADDGYRKRILPFLEKSLLERGGAGA